MQDKKLKLKRKLYYLMNKIKKVGSVMRGSIVELKVNCGNKKCRCYKDKKWKHPAYYFSVNMNKKTKLIYLGKNKLPLAKEYNENYLKLKQIIDEITIINMELLKLS